MNIDILFIKDQSSPLRVAKAHEPDICPLKGFQVRVSLSTLLVLQAFIFTKRIIRWIPVGYC